MILRTSPLFLCVILISAWEKKKEKKRKVEEVAEKTGEVVGKGVKKGWGTTKSIGKGLVRGVKGEKKKVDRSNTRDI